MPDTPAVATAPDVRRAAALLVHSANRHADGVSHVLAEANQLDRATELVLGLCAVFEYVVPELRTPIAIAAVQQQIAKLAELEDEQQ